MITRLDAVFKNLVPSPVFSRCEIVAGSPTTSHEIQGVGFFAEDEIPELSLTRIMPSQIARMFEHYRQPDLPADFD
jgi:hypothetical protein